METSLVCIRSYGYFLQSIANSYVRKSLISYVRMVPDGKKPGGSWAGVGATPERWGTLSLEFGSSDLVCEACGLLGHWLRLREELREMQAVKLLLRMVPPGLWRQFPAAEQRTVPAPAMAWQMVQGSSRLGRPAARPGHGGQLWCRVRGTQGSAMPSG